VFTLAARMVSAQGRRLAILATSLILIACTPLARPVASVPTAAPLQATLVLDWFPNTNHVGIYLAQANGWYSEQGLDLRIEAPSDANAAMKLVGAGNAELGISYQPAVTIARSQDVPVVSVAALVQHNLGAFAAKKASGITRPKEFEGKRYGSTGLPQGRMQFETAIRCDGGDPSRVEEVTLGQQISQALLADRVDFMGMLPTWEGIELEMKGVELNYMPYRDFCIPDSYHLVFISGEAAVRDKPEVIKRFMAATQRGYETAVRDPSAAAATLLTAAPDLNPELVRTSLERLTPFFVAESPRWGVQDGERWKHYADWMAENKLIAKPIDAARAFSDDFLPK
jgi:ABC-type nitrate/sulfonate/bicarbonate transport system substrate-binding protein